MACLTVSSIAHPVSITSAKIKKLELYLIHKDIQLNGLSIETLVIHDCKTATFRLTDCFVGNLTLAEKSVQNFYVSGGAILNFECPPPKGNNPFTGSVSFDNRVYFPKKSGTLLRGAQPYRNMKAHMSALENAPMMSRFHELEQQVERRDLGRFDRFLSLGYKCFSNYGSASWKPVMWIFLLLLVTFALGLIDGGAASGELTGWQTSLQGEQWQARVARAASLALQATLNPLGIFGTKGAVVSKSGWLAMWLFMHGVFSTLFIALLILAVRRRFKVS